MNPINILLAVLGVLAVGFVGIWGRAIASVKGEAPSPATEVGAPTLLGCVIGAVTNFFDALGIGSFATTTALFRAFAMVPDRIIPGTLNVGHTLPTVVQAFFFISVIPVDVTTLVSMIVAAVAGAYFGAGIVAGWSKRKVQVGMGFALLAAAIFFTMRNLQLFPSPEVHTIQSLPANAVQATLPDDLASRMFIPVTVAERPAGSNEAFVDLKDSAWSFSGGQITLPASTAPRDIRLASAPVGVRGVKVVVAAAGNFLLGALMSLGIGLYAPCMILVGLLGMSEKTAFPIMMGSCAFLMPVGSTKFIKERAYSLRAALGLALGGIPGVVVAVKIVESMNLVTVRWLVIVVVIYTAVTMLYSAFLQDSAGRDDGLAR
jgi:uncharacterized membrane protein YfcA